MKKNFIYQLCAIAIAAFIFSSCSSNQNQMADKAPAFKYRAGVDVVFSSFASGNTDGFDTLIDANYIDHTPPPGMEIKGVESLKNMVKMWKESMPDVKIEVLDYAENGDLAMIHYRFTGTNTGTMMGMPATGKSVDANGVDILKFSNGKCTDHWGYFEEVKYLTQLGMMPDMSAMTDTTKKK